MKKEKIGLLIDPENITDLINAILNLKNHPELRNEFSKNAQELSKTWNWPTMEKKLLLLYRDLSHDIH